MGYFQQGATYSAIYRTVPINHVFSSPEEINSLLTSELSMTTAALKAHPKVYWIWNHRQWCLENVPEGPGQDGADFYGWRKGNWDRELYVVEKMLDADASNCSFPMRTPIHSVRTDGNSVVLAWNYRRYVLASMPVQRSKVSELTYTKRKIEANFSNFSAWHQRSKVYTSLWDSGSLDPIKCREEGLSCRLRVSPSSCH
jgi:geranylgeranyl transferase type-2 subunit alpha